MTIYIPLMDSPAAGAAQPDAVRGASVFLAGLDRTEALAAFDLYRVYTTRGLLTFNRFLLRMTSGINITRVARDQYRYRPGRDLDDRLDRAGDRGPAVPVAVPD